jgi:guanylate kinase
MAQDPASRGRLVIFSAPSGAGKTSIVRHLLDQDLNLAFSVSATTRAPRAGEVDGRDYHFLGIDDFKARVHAGDFVEWEEVYPGRFYGTLRSELERIWAGGRHALFDIDVIGGLDLKELFQDRALAVFVQPPSVEALEQRLRERGTENGETLRMRVDKAVHELGYADRFDAVVVNDRLPQACAEAEALVRRFLRP